MTIKEFFLNAQNKPTKARRQFVKYFVGNDRKLVARCLELSQTATEQELLQIWRTN